MDNQARVDDYLERFATNDARCASGDSRCVENPEVPYYLYYPSWIRHDFTVSYSTQTDWAGDLRLFAGVKNVFDDCGPFIPRTGDNYERGIGNYDSKYDGGVGRFVYLGAEMRF